ncbi:MULTISPECIES: DUF2934 domain-containing protein [Rhizobium]|uniref:DUF2934 domain-containing protein n=1 Tax=Rhizobium rhododendri TaxID=2506430 RepID=A0ABY8IHN5_9HYPH|nr:MULTISPECIES: DUF2934 domain-containing protein [Rhizobium]MBZ5759766.1 DUF2934 domain-containing protein [Rhizobium sp. VS19-DR96]MBZ5766154.1 DUF2934 domain-containing protein [Rhizobium sp. VS19-DR129.2]MBZ5772937.1 DUF2934 domain-containing protein [Rhizobium sp. VS19-DRK62.2]MBZ5783921.1 DUF2934 domain-containing protein [Rhizobium sp. VS19-DR121]MBZ5803498.1 DUF2934 domain-containing protein [Rhizobium sp. VS19-DR181]
MTESRDEWIMKRAYALWEEEGYPTGRDSIHWEQATKERAVMETTAPHGLAVKPKAKTTSSKAAKANGSTPAPALSPKRSTKKDVTAKA